MEKPRVLSGEQLVAKGITKIDASLPELGLKDVIPNGSWLEQKQIQAALEARKYLIEVERIEKCGILSHAVWRDDLMLAEVTQISGGHWQYLGHNVGKKLYLHPEETLFLMEVNCLLLKHNEVTVSLQKAYALLLRSPTTLIQYKVYASLSRIGYKVLRHKAPKGKSNCQKVSLGNESVNTDSHSLSTDGKDEFVDSAMVNTGNKREKMHTNESENLDLYKNKSENLDLPLVNSINVSKNLDIPKASRDKESESVDTDIVSAVSESVNMNSPKVGPSNESRNVSPTIVETVIKCENVDSQDSNIINEVADVTSHTYETYKVKESNDQDNETNNYVTVISKETDDEETIATTDMGNDAVKDDKSPVIMEIDNIGANSGDVASQGVTYEDVSSTVTEYDENIDEVKKCKEICQEAVDSGVVLMEEDGNIENSMIPDSAVPLDPDNQNIKDNTPFDEDFTKNNSDLTISNNSTTTHISRHNLVYDYPNKIGRLTKRQQKPSDPKSIQKYFENIPDLYKKQVVTVNVPEQEFIPRNIYVHNSSYLLNLLTIKRRSHRSPSNESAAYTSSDEANETVRRIRNTSGSEYYHNLNFSPHISFPRHHHFRPYGFWRPQNNLNFYQFSMFFQRPSFSNMYIQSRVQYLPRQNHVLRSFSYPSNLGQNNPNLCHNSRKRTRTGRVAHLQGIKNLAVRLKQFLISGNTEMHNLESLHNQLHSYNSRYKTRLRLTNNFDVVNEENIIETIELDDDEESKSKKPRLDQDHDDKFDENLYRLRQLALRLRDLETKDLRTTSHKRAFSKALKTFNKSYNTDMYLDDDNYEVLDRRCITVKSSSESDCVVEETPKVTKKVKKLRNPFNILKRRSERLLSLNNPGTSKDLDAEDTSTTETEPNRAETEGNEAYSERIVSTFDKVWLPNEGDFGRAEILPNRFMNARLIDSNKEQYIFDFMKNQFQEYENWLEAKISFLRHLHETNIAFQNEQARILADSKLCNTGLRPLINSGDNSDMPSVLEKLRIIKNNKEICSKNSLAIDFDVYNRDVQNFRKTNPPKPHFRIICLHESSSFPSAAEVMGLHSKYDDNIAIVFAIVGIDSVSYLQINPIDLPVYVPSNYV